MKEWSGVHGVSEWTVTRRPGPPPQRPAGGPHHCDGVVEQGLPEDDDEQHLVDVHLLEHGQHGHRVHSGNQAAEQQEVQQPDVQVS